MTKPKDVQALLKQIFDLQQTNTINCENYAQLKAAHELLEHNHRCFLEAYRNVYARMVKAEALVNFAKRFWAAN